MTVVTPKAGLAEHDDPAQQPARKAEQDKAAEEAAEHEQKIYERTEKRALDRELSASTTRLGYFTLFLVFATGLLWWSTYRLSNDAKKAAAKQEENTLAALEISRQTAAAAAKSAQVAERSLVTSQRAFIFLSSMSGGPNTDGPTISRDTIINFLVKWTFENHGNTYATDVNTQAGFKIVPVGSPVPKFVAPPDRLPTVVAPHATWIAPIRALQVADVVACWQRTRDIYFWSKVEYRDIFSPEIVHHTESVSRLTINRDPMEPVPSGHPAVWHFFNVGDQNTVS